MIQNNNIPVAGTTETFKEEVVNSSINFPVAGTTETVITEVVE